MLITLVRHGQTISNMNDHIQGQEDGELSELGKRQSEAVAERLLQLEFGAIYCSDLGRTRETLQPYLDLSSASEVNYLKSIREKAYGELEGIVAQEYLQLVEESEDSRLGFRCPGGENFYDVHERVGEFLEGIRKKHVGESLLVVSHGGPIKAMLSHLLNKPFEETFLQEIRNCSVSQFQLGEGLEAECILLNAIEHLPVG